MPTGNGEPVYLWLFQDIDEGRSVRMSSTDPGLYLADLQRAEVEIDAIYDGTMVDTVSRQLTHLTSSLRGPQGLEMYVKLIFRSRR